MIIPDLHNILRPDIGFNIRRLFSKDNDLTEGHQNIQLSFFLLGQVFLVMVAPAVKKKDSDIIFFEWLLIKIYERVCFLVISGGTILK